MLWKCCTQYASKFGKLSSGHRTGECQFSFQSQRKEMPKNAQTTTQLHSSQTLVKWCLKFSRPGFSYTWSVNCELPYVQADFRKGRGIRDQIANIHWIIKKAREFQKTSISALLTMPKPLTVWITTNWKTLKEKGIPDHLTCLLWNQYAEQEETEPDMKQWTGSKLGKEYVKTVCCYPVYLTSMQSPAYEMPGWMTHKLESRLWGEISITSDMQMTPPLWQKAKRN